MKIIALVALFALTHVCGQATTHTYPATFVPPYQLKCTSTQTGLAATQYIPTVTTTADVQIGTTSYGNYASTASTSRAVLGLDATGILAFVAGEDSAAPSGTDAAQVTNIVNKIKTVGTVTNEVQSLTTTWIPGATAVEYTADLAITQTPRSLIESIANAVFGTSTYSWSTTANGASTSSWKLQFFFVHHTTPSPMWTYTISVSSAATWNYGTGAYGHGAAYFEFSDLLYGNSFATSTYVLGDYCDRFLTTGVKPIDIIFTVDNSGSMGAHQDAVAQLGTVIQAQLANAGIDWRIALVTSSFYYNYYSNNACDGRTCGNTNTYLCRYFTRDIAVVQSWLQQTQPSTWIGAGGTCGNSNERCVYSMQLFLSAAPKVGTTNLAHVWPPTSPEDSKFLRTNINLVLIVLGDADDQQYSSASTCTGASGSQCGILSYVAFYAGIRAALQDGLFLGGIICPTTSVCSETQNSPRVTRGWLEDPSSQAVIGSIVDTPSIQTTVLAIFNKILAASSPYKLSKNNALASSIQVLMSPSDTLGNCIVQYNNVATNEIPRSISNGFDYRSGNVVLYGNCRPNKDNANLIVNYKYWLKAVCGDGLVQSNEQCDPNATSTSTSPACCSSTCQLLPAGTPCVAGGTCTGLSNVCDASGTCVVASCPPVQNYCDVFINCDVNGCHYQNRSCLPVNCFKRTCDRTAINTAHTFANGTQMPGDCVFVQIETGYQCDTVYCTIDACGVCQGDNSTCKDCRGVPNGGLSYDVCGICGGNGQSCIGCDGVLFGPKRDSCGVCGGNNLSCVSCTLVPGGQIGVDACGVCQGDGKSCLPTYDFVVSVPAGTALDCTTAIAQATASLVAAGKSPSTGQVQCDVMPVGCTGESNYLTYCNSTLVQVIVKIRQDVWNGTSVTAATQLATLNAAPSSFTTNLATTLGIPTTSISAVAVYTAPVPTSASGSPSASGGTASGSVSGGSGSVSASGSVSGSVGSASSGSVSGGGSSSPATSATSSIPPTQAQGYTVTVPAINDPTVLANAQSALQAAIAQQYPAAVFTITSTTSNGNTVFTVTFDTTAGTVPNLAQFQQTVTNNVAPTWTSSGAIPAGTTPAVEPAVIAATTDASLALPMLLSLLL